MCHEGYFRCESGTCIPKAKHCDSYPDCPNRDDENDCGNLLFSYIPMYAELYISLDMYNK